MRLWACALALAFVLVPPAGADDSSAPPTSEGRGRLVDDPFVPTVGGPRLTERIVVTRLLDEPKVARWLDRYPPHPNTDATFDNASRRWTVRVWSGKAGEVALGKIGRAHV